MRARIEEIALVGGYWTAEDSLVLQTLQRFPKASFHVIPEVAVNWAILRTIIPRRRLVLLGQSFERDSLDQCTRRQHRTHRLRARTHSESMSGACPPKAHNPL